MTDKFGEDSHEGQHNETWDDNQPPVDTFHDTDVSAEGMATVSEEAGEHTEHQIEEGSEAQPVEGQKKSSKLIPLVAGVGLLLVLAAGLFWQFGMGASSPTTVTAQVAPMRPPGAAEVPSLPGGENKPKMQEAALAPLSDLVGLTNGAATAPAPTNVSSGGSALPSTNDTPSTVVPNSEQRPAAPLGQDQSVAALQVAPPAQAVMTPPGQDLSANNKGAKGANASNENFTELDGRLNALSGHVEDLQKSLDQTAQQLLQISAQLSANQAKGPVDQAFEDRLNQIEQHLAQIERNPPALSSPASVKSDQSLNTSGVQAKAEGENTASSSKRHVRTHHEKRVATRVTKHKASRVASHSEPRVLASSSGILVQPKSSWILRAATPNEAWLAKNDSSSELTHIQLGQQFPGLGVVQSIRPVGDSWVIEGTEGSIH